MSESYFMGLDGFVWFTGVVENRQDPAKLGRVQVRCLGFHSEKLTDIPTEDLPWAHVMHPVTDPAMQGLGNTPSFLVEGTWVVGFFRDAVEKQQPVIMGTLPGYPSATPDINKGFNDPTGKYPSEAITNSNHSINETDVNRLGQGIVSETHLALQKRRVSRLSTDDNTSINPSVDIATRPYIQNKQDAVQEERTTWDEPAPKGLLPNDPLYNSGEYPYNHVFESESGHIFETDDTPGAERLLRQHKSGTFEEIHPDGKRVVKIVGDNYEIVAGKSNVFIKGDVNLTVDGNKRELIKGDYVLEVQGNMYEKVHKDKDMKVGASGVGNLSEEILGNHGFNIKNSVVGVVGTDDAGLDKDYSLTIKGKRSEQVGGTYELTTADTFTLFSLEDIDILAGTKLAATSVTDLTSITSGTSLNIKSASNMAIKTEAKYNLQIVGESNIRYEGDRHIYRGADDYARHDGGVNYTCSSDPSRTSDNDCTDVEEV